MKRVRGPMLVAGACAIVACGGSDQIGVGDTLETEGGATYTVAKATVAETEEALYEALGQEPPAPALPSVPGTAPVQPQSYGPPSGVYVAVELNETGAAGQAEADGEAKDGDRGGFVLLGADDEEYTSQAFQIGFDIESISEDGGGADEFTTTGIFDVPAEATDGARLQIEEGENTYTIELGL